MPTHNEQAKSYLGKYRVSYRELGHRLNVSAATVSDWCNGVREIPLEYRLRILRELTRESVAQNDLRDPPQPEYLLTNEEVSLVVSVFGNVMQRWRKEDIAQALKDERDAKEVHAILMEKV